MTDLDALLAFAREHNYGNLPFNQVLDLWDLDIKQTIEEQEADAWNASMEAHELEYLDLL